MSALRKIFGKIVKKPVMSTKGIDELSSGLGRLKIEEDTKKCNFEVATLALS